MSGSFKKVPSRHMVKKDAEAKSRASKRVRGTAQKGVLLNGGSYKKAFESYDIADWHETRTTYERHRERQKAFGMYRDERQCRNDYERQYRRK